MSAAGDDYAAADTAALDFSDLLDLPESAFAQYDAVDPQGLVAEDVPGFDVTKYVPTVPVSPASSDTASKLRARGLVGRLGRTTTG